MTKRTGTSSSGTTRSLTTLGEPSEKSRLGGYVPAKTAALVLLAIAVALRAVQYISNTSISLDEAALTLNVAHRSYSGLLDTLDFNQGAPPVFLALEKLTLDALGNSEYALRAVPFVAGIASVFLLIPFLRRFVNEQITEALTLTLFGSSTSLVLYSAIGKPYALDVVTTLVCYILAFETMRRHAPKRMVVFAVAGCLALWLSFASVFVLSGIGLTLILRSAGLRRWRDAAAYSMAACAWLVSFAVLYFVSLQDLGHLQRSISSDTGSTGGDPLDTAQTLGGAFRSVLGVGGLVVGGHDLGRLVAALALLLGAVGVIVLVREMPVSAALLAMPIFLTLIASKLGRYPLFPRTLLFLAPGFLVFVAYGTVWLAVRSRARFVGALGMAIVLAFVAAPAIKAVLHPQKFADLRPALRYLAGHQREADTLWVFGATQYELRYYLECKCFAEATLIRRGEHLWPLDPAPGGPDQFDPALDSVPPRFIVSRAIGSSEAYRKELRNLIGRPRVWVLVSEAGPEVRAPIVKFLDRLGTGRLAFRAGNFGTTARIYLYDLSHGH